MCQVPLLMACFSASLEKPGAGVITILQITGLMRDRDLSHNCQVRVMQADPAVDLVNKGASMQSLISDTVDSSQPMMLCHPWGHLRASIFHLGVAGKIAVPHMVLHTFHTAACSAFPSPSPSTA